MKTGRGYGSICHVRTEPSRVSHSPGVGSTLIYWNSSRIRRDRHLRRTVGS